MINAMKNLHNFFFVIIDHYGKGYGFIECL